MATQTQSKISREVGNKFLGELERFAVTDEELETAMASNREMWEIARCVQDRSRRIKENPGVDPDWRGGGYCR